MSIKTDKQKCTGCGKCRQVCPGSLLYADQTGKTYIKYPEDCWGCTSCVKECDFSAIRYYLGADIGGNGKSLCVRQEGSLMHWIIAGPDGDEEVITIDKNKANAY